MRKGEGGRGKEEKEDGGAEGRSNDALSHAESRLDNRDRTAPLPRRAKRRRPRHSNISFRVLTALPSSLSLSLFLSFPFFFFFLTTH